MASILLLGYCLAIFMASLLGAWLPRHFHMTHTRTQLIMSLVAGLMLGVAFFHLIPHSASDGAGSIDLTMAWVVAGLVFMLLLLRLFHFHQHDFAEADEGCQHHPDAHAHADAHDHAHAAPTKGPFTWLGLLFGLSIHTIVDGIALGAVMRAEPHGEAGILGIGVFMAILLHKPLDSLSIETVASASGLAAAQRQAINIIFALLCPVVALAFWGLINPDQTGGLLLSSALAFSAGAFICIALGDLLPEIQFHSHDRFKLTALFVVGIGLAWSIGIIETGHHL